MTHEPPNPFLIVGFFYAAGFVSSTVITGILWAVYQWGKRSAK